jgi:hypothetical protein
LIGYDGNLRDGNLAEFRSRIVYTDSPPAVGSIPLTYDDYAQMNNLQGGRKKTRNSKNRKPKITQKYKKRRGRR